VTTLLCHIAFMRNVFCFNGFNQTTIVLRYSVHIKPRKPHSEILPPWPDVVASGHACSNPSTESHIKGKAQKE